MVSCPLSDGSACAWLQRYWQLTREPRVRVVAPEVVQLVGAVARHPRLLAGIDGQRCWSCGYLEMFVMMDGCCFGGVRTKVLTLTPSCAPHQIPRD